MRYEDAKLLLEFARLQLEIARAKQAPGCPVDITPATVHKSTGFRRLRAFFVELSDRKRERFRRDMRSQIDGVREVMARAKATGEELSLADLTIEILDDATKRPVSVPSELGIELIAAAPSRLSCPGGTSSDTADPDGSRWVACGACGRRWNAYEVGFTLPAHEVAA